MEKLKEKLFKMVSASGRKSISKNKSPSKKAMTFDPFAIAIQEEKLLSNRTKFKQFHSSTSMESDTTSAKK